MPSAKSILDAPDATLVRGALAGDRLAFGALFDRYARVIRALAYDVTKDVNSASDLTQETFLRAWRDVGRLREPDRFAPWLVGIARHVGQEWRRGRPRSSAASLEIATDCIATDERTPRDATSVADDDLNRLRAEIAALPDAERLALHAFYLMELDPERARAIVGVSRSGLYKLLTRARGMLRARLGAVETRR